MKKWLCSIAGLSFALTASMATSAQTNPGHPPNILGIQVDNVKPYLMAPYIKVAAKYPGVSISVKDPEHYLGMDSMSGATRSMYFFGYDSYEAMQKAIEAFMSNSANRAKFDALDAEEAPYVTESHYYLWHYRPDLSNNVEGADIPHTHYWEVIIFHMKPGHDEGFEELTKIYRDTNLKIGQNISWATYEPLQGMTDAYLILVPMTSLKDEDTGLAKEKDFGEALGEEGMHRMDRLTEDSVASVEDNIWMTDPASSYVEKAWVDADPHYWMPKPAMKPAAKPAPAAAPAPKPAAQ